VERVGDPAETRPDDLLPGQGKSHPCPEWIVPAFPGALAHLRVGVGHGDCGGRVSRHAIATRRAAMDTRVRRGGANRRRARRAHHRWHECRRVRRVETSACSSFSLEYKLLCS
jgi:hypothetical protein